jgi:membrane protein
MKVSHLWLLMKKSVSSWYADDAPSMGAALAFYTLFSIAPLLVIVIAITGTVFSNDTVQGYILEQLRGLMGEEGALAVQGLLIRAIDPGKSTLAAIAGVITSILGATTVFAELNSDLNRIWRVPMAQVGGVRYFIRTRVLSFGLILGIGFVLLVSLVVSAALAALGAWWGSFFGEWQVLLQVINFGVSFAIVTLVFAMIYKLLPRARIGWRDVWIGATVTALLFVLGKLFIGEYLGRIGTTSAFGAAGSLMALLVWVYYSAQIFFLGAEFTWVYAYSHGSRAGGPKAEPGRPDQGGPSANRATGTAP